MKLLVDTSVWSLMLYRKKDSNHPASAFLQEKIKEGVSICITGVIYQEILQGIRAETHFYKVRNYLLDFDFLEVTPLLHEKAAMVYQKCRKKGIQIHTVDALIVALAIGYNASLLTTDKDFERMAAFVNLQLVGIP